MSACCFDGFFIATIEDNAIAVARGDIVERDGFVFADVKADVKAT